MRTIRLIPFAIAAVLASGCSNEEDATVEVGVSSSSSALTASSDVPADTQVDTSGTPAAGHAAAHVRVTVRAIRVHVAGDGGDDNGSADKSKRPDAPADDDGTGDGWVTVFSGEKTIELDRTTSLDSVLGSAHVKAGKVTQIRLVLDGQAVLVEGGTETPLACGSCDTSGLKVIPRNLRLDPGERGHFLLAIDLDQSLVDEGGALRLKPVIRLARGD